MKVVINSCFGGFDLSQKAQLEYAHRKGFDLYFYKQTKHGFREGADEFRKVNENSKDLFVFALKSDLGDVTNELSDGVFFSDSDIPRDDPDLVSVVEQLGSEASTSVSNLVVVDIPDDIEYEIEEYDGYEHVAEKHRTWG